MSFEQTGIRPAEILLPAPSVQAETWACIACDQYTSEPEYWRKSSALVGDSPSALRLILPEAELSGDYQQRVPEIHAAMRRCLKLGVDNVTTRKPDVLAAMVNEQ